MTTDNLKEMTVSDNEELIARLPSKVWRKIIKADKYLELVQALEDHDSEYKFDVIEFCVAHKIGLKALDLEKIHQGAKEVKKPVKARTKIVQSKYFSKSIGQHGWGTSLVVIKSIRTPPRLAPDFPGQYSDSDLQPSRGKRRKPPKSSSEYSGFIKTNNEEGKSTN